MKRRTYISLFTIPSVLIPTAGIISGCSCSNQQYKIIPFELLDIKDTTVYGLKKDADVSKYDTLEIPDGKKAIANNAFANTFTNKLNKNIKFLKIPNTLRKIGAGAFLNDNSFETISFINCDEEFSRSCKVQPIVEGTNGEHGSFQNIRPVGDTIFSTTLQTKASLKTLKTKLLASGINEPWFIQQTLGNISYLEETKSKRSIGGSAQYSFKLAKPLDELKVYEWVTSAPNNVTISATIDVTDLEATLNVNLYDANDGDIVKFDITFVGKTNGGTIWKQSINNFSIFRKDEEFDTTLNIDNQGVCNGFRNGATKEQILTEFDKNELLIPERVTAIGDLAFNPSVASVPIPSALTSVKFEGENCLTIGKGAFYCCEDINSFELPNSITEIKEHAFAANVFDSFTLPTSLTAIGDAGFYQCKKITSITFPNTLQSVGYGAFAKCSKLKTLDFSNYVSTPNWKANNEIFYGIDVSAESKGTIKIATGQELEKWQIFLKSINLDLDCWDIIQIGGR